MQCSYDVESAKLLGICWLDPSLYQAVLADPVAFGLNAEMLTAFQQADSMRPDTLMDEKIPLALDSLKDLMAGMCRVCC